MPWPDIRDEDQLTWRFVVVNNEPDFYDNPTVSVDPPEAWVDAIVVVARDLRCFRSVLPVRPRCQSGSADMGPVRRAW